MHRRTSFLRKSRHGSLYCFRRRVPQELQNSLGMREIVRSLNTADLKVATLRSRALAAETDRLFAALRSRMPEVLTCSLIVSFDELGLPRLKTEPGDSPEVIEAAVRGIAARPPHVVPLAPETTTPIVPARARPALPLAGPTLPQIMEMWRKARVIGTKTASDYAVAVPCEPKTRFAGFAVCTRRRARTRPIPRQCSRTPPSPPMMVRTYCVPGSHPWPGFADITVRVENSTQTQACGHFDVQLRPVGERDDGH